MTDKAGCKWKVRVVDIVTCHHPTLSAMPKSQKRLLILAGYSVPEIASRKMSNAAS
jgi:RecB family exonuclease